MYPRVCPGPWPSKIYVRMGSMTGSPGIWRVLSQDKALSSGRRLTIKTICGERLCAKDGKASGVLFAIWFAGDLANVLLIRCKLETSSTYDHRVWKIGLPVRSAVLKPPIERGRVRNEPFLSRCFMGEQR
ncbi:hypothetical protein BO82DRAFT_166826 [Aspergillus uvarum CBS 121591]|uniref:Uncharacterized protein n=1 Tax=Aspergillus uvarum CBS 121591 TaxID=1448315 RepID=A0A319CR63_9EURO|nr:hypothetical protein BO82DRAFT_166826 [Aspergillus uvarum CBS 121591]PYH78028.1 hypothetical protein BO82DRAFT_166826 [Aspergillus uvarum CBS 121591]